MLGDEQSVRTFSTIVANAHAAPNGQNQRYRSGSSGTSLFGTREPIDEAEKARAEAVKAEADKAIRSQASLNEAELQRLQKRIEERAKEVEATLQLTPAQRDLLALDRAREDRVMAARVAAKRLDDTQDQFIDQSRLQELKQEAQAKLVDEIKQAFAAQKEADEANTTRMEEIKKESLKDIRQAIDEHLGARSADQEDLFTSVTDYVESMIIEPSLERFINEHRQGSDMATKKVKDESQQQVYHQIVQACLGVGGLPTSVGLPTNQVPPESRKPPGGWDILAPFRPKSPPD